MFHKQRVQVHVATERPHVNRKHELKAKIVKYRFNQSNIPQKPNKKPKFTSQPTQHNRYVHRFATFLSRMSLHHQQQ